MHANCSYMVLLTIILASSFVAAAIIPIEALNTRNLETLVEKRNGTDVKGCLFKEYVSLGDSYAAGINADPNGRLPLCPTNNILARGPGADCTTEPCAKNTGSYAYQFFQLQKPADFTYVACSGAKTADVLNLQIPLIPTSADLVTINIGGNNNDAFASVVEHCVYLLGIGCKEALQNAQNSINGIGPAISDLFTAIQKKTPNARVLVMSYVRFWPVFYDNSLCKNDPLKVPSADQKADMNSLVDQMNQVLSSSAEAHGFWFIDVNPNFEGHRLCDKQAAYIQGDLLPGDEKNITSNAANSTDNVGDWYNKGVFHPNLEGHFQYRMLIESALGCGA